MYEESATFDPNPIPGLPEDGFSDTHIPNCAAVEEPLYHHHHHSAAAAMDVENIQHQLNMQIDNCCYNNNNPTGAAAAAAHHHHTEVETQPNWETAVHSLPEMGFYNHHHQQDQHHHFQQQNYTSSSLPETPYPTTPDLLNLFHLPRTSAASLLPNSSISFTNPNPGQNLLYDPLLPLNLPPHPPSFRDLFQSLPHNYGLPGSRGSGTLFGGLEEREENGILYQGGGGGGDMREYDSGLLEFTREMNCIVKGRNGKDTKHFATEKQRREHLNGKYHTLRSLVPNPTKPDRASVVGDAIEYIKELLRTVNELKILVEKKRCARERIKRQKIHDDGSGDPSDVAASATAKPPNSGEHGGDQQLFDGSSSLRSSWLQRKSKNSEIDVRIIHDEVTIKLAQQKRINCLLPVSKVLDELQLDLHHVAGGLVGNYYSFLFNTKICEGSSVYASAIANRLIEAVERQYAAVPTTSSY